MVDVPSDIRGGNSNRMLWRKGDCKSGMEQGIKVIEAAFAVGHIVALKLLPRC